MGTMIREMIATDDPYGSATKLIKDVIREALYRSQRMSTVERDNLVAIEEYVRERDNA